MKRPSRWRELLQWLLEGLRAAAFILLVVIVWGVTAYVCGRQAMLITEEGARALVRQLLPGLW